MSTDVQTQTPMLDPENPWPGLHSYDESGAPFFHGRDREIGELQRLIVQAPLTVLFGKSGLGKSSLLRAGLFPMLRAANMLPVYLRFEFGGVTPMPLVEQLAAAFAAECTRVGADSPLRASGQSFWEYLHRDDFRIWSAQNQPLTPVFVLDQLEEVITLGGGHPELVEAWRDDLADLAENRIPVVTARALAARRETSGLKLKRYEYRMLLSFREDFATVFERWPELPSLMRNRFQLDPMSGLQALDAVTKSAGHLIDVAVAEEVVRFVGSQTDPASGAQESAVLPAAPAGANSPLGELLIEPAFLSLVCRGLNEQRKREGKRVIESEFLRQTGRGLVDQYYDECMSDQPESVHRFVENELITETGYRKPCARDDASRPPYYIEWNELGILVQRRLLRVLPSAQLSSVELVHDLLAPTVLMRRNRRRGDPAQFQLALRRIRRTDESPANTVDPANQLRCRVVNGDLSFEHVPLLVGHYETSRLTGTELTADLRMGGAMSRSLSLGIYPTAPGETQLFRNSRTGTLESLLTPIPPSVVVAGLGVDGHLRSADLRLSVRQAVITILQQPTGASRNAKRLVLASTLLGSGGAGISAGLAAQLVAEGVYDANEAFSSEPSGARVSELRLIERYSDRAEQAWRSLRTLSTARPERFCVAREIEEGENSLERPLAFGYRGTDTDLLQIQTAFAGDGDRFDYEFYSAQRIDAVKATVASVSLVRELVSRASNERNPAPGLGETLYQLLVPAELQTLFESTNGLQLELDARTATFPWELLERETADAASRMPWAIRAKVVRTLRTSAYRPKIVRNPTDASALIVGEPRTPPEYPRLYGAQAEAHEAERVLTSASALSSKNVLTLAAGDLASRGPDAQTVMSALLAREWRIVHLAGHIVPPDGSGGGGLLLSNGTMLGPSELATLRVIPEFVFLNGCYSSSSKSAALADIQYDRVLVAAGTAEALMSIGVRAVVVAGWMVEDVAAHVFARTLYAALLNGSRLADAVADARRLAYELGGATWGGYQCYGDPDWRLRTRVADEQIPPPAYNQVASSRALVLLLKSIETRLRFDGADREHELQTVRMLDKQYASRWAASGAVAEVFASAYAATRDLDSAVAWYDRAIAAPDGRAALRAVEQLGNLKVRAAWQTFEIESASPSASTGDETVVPRRKRAATAVSSQADRTVAATRARQQVGEALSLYDRLLSFRPTLELESLYGAALKRLALIETYVGRHAAARRAVAGMHAHYLRACELARERMSGEFYYPALNYLAADLSLNVGRRGWKGFDPSIVQSISASLEAKNLRDPDFWSVVGQTELDLYNALAAGKLASERESLEKDYRDLYRRVSAPWLWSSVYDTAQFVLRKYSARASDKESKAAEALLTCLMTFAQPK